jgi:hypothetical protein
VGRCEAPPLYINQLGMAPCKWGICFVLKYCVCSVWRRRHNRATDKFRNKGVPSEEDVCCALQQPGLGAWAWVCVGLVETTSWHVGTVALSE